MPRQPNRSGGGARTNVNGLHFEQTTSLDTALHNAGYDVIDYEVFLNDEVIGMSVPQAKLYSKFLKPRKIDYRKYNSKQWRPDEAFINFQNNIAYIIEKKYQHGSGSVDEKLPNCVFKKQEYEKLFKPLGFDVEFIYVLSDWFHDPRYRDTLEYIEDVGCYYYYNDLPLEAIGL